MLSTTLITACVVALIAICTEYSVRVGFSDYVAKTDLASIDSLAPLLERAYVEHSGWGFARQDTSQVWDLIGLNERIHSPRHSTEVPDKFPNRLPGEVPYQNAADGVAPFPAHRMDVFKRLAVFDTKDELVWGNPRAKTSNFSVPLRVSGKEIGSLKMAPSLVLASQMGTDFISEQNRNLLAVSAVGLLLSIAAALALTKHFMAPIRELAIATRKLANGRFNTRIKVNRRDELGQLAEDFNKLGEALQAHEQAQKQWVADTSHELRTPIAILRAQVEAIQDGVHSVSPKTLGVLHGEIMMISKLIDDLYELAKSDAKQFKCVSVPVQIISVLDDALNAFEKRLGAQGISLERGGVGNADIVVSGDAGRLTQLFMNLLENTLRYTDQGGVLRVSTVCSTVNGAEQLTIVFEDSAPGVPPHLMDKIFDRFVRADDARTHAIGGTGLGLSICRTIADAHDATITATDSELGGLRVEFTIPVERSTVHA